MPHANPRAGRRYVTEPSIVDGLLTHSGLAPVAHALRKDRVEAHQLRRRKGHRIIAYGYWLELAFENVASKRATRGDAHRGVNRHELIALSGRIQGKRLLDLDAVEPASVLAF
jgi:hypothetical protein